MARVWYNNTIIPSRYIVNPINAKIEPSISNVANDAFGRLRISEPFTLFDSSHRYADNGLWTTEVVSGGTSVFNSNEGLVDLNTTSSNSSSVTRETYKVFAYQPGKSLLLMSSFVAAAQKTGLRQRIGYFGNENGIYFELNDINKPQFVERSSITGSVVNTGVSQNDWNVDKLDGTGPSGLTADFTKVQIFWTDIEWLGSGTVRVGFIINGNFVLCHTFDHANLIASTYITTACLPCRLEITNTSATGSSSTLKQICTTVLSEGGYELSGAQNFAATDIATPYNLTNADTYYPIVSLRLKATPNRLDAIVIPTAVSVVGLSNNANYSLQLIYRGTTTGGTWVSGGSDSSIEYNITGTSFNSTGARKITNSWFQGSNQGQSVINITKPNLFRFQLERNSLTNTPFEATLVIATDNAGSDVYASFDWEEVTR
jgi:hypothetical protein